MITLAGKHIHIVGGSRGIGSATALIAAQAGADISFTYRSRADAADAVASRVRSCGRRVFSMAADAASDGAMENTLDQAVEHLGPISGLVVSAGIFEPGRIEDMTLAFWNRMMSANLTSTFLAVKAAARHLRMANNGGSMVIYTSTAGQRGSDVYSAYATSKGAQILFMRSMARELAPDRIRVNAIAPSWTETDMSRQTMDDLGRTQLLANCPLGRVGTPEDVANATVYLLSDLAQFITGTTMTVDGGIDMRG